MNFVCLLMSDSRLSLIKRQTKFILLKLRKTTSPNDRFGINDRFRILVEVEGIKPWYFIVSNEIPRHFFVFGAFMGVFLHEKK